MQTIEIDFDVFKALTARRVNAETTYNDVLRDVLRLPSLKSKRHRPTTLGAWVVKGVTFPESTEFRARYKGREYRATAESGAMMYDGSRFKSPSAAAIAITGNSVNGWKFWECRRPGESSWRLMYSIWKDGQS